MPSCFSEKIYIFSPHTHTLLHGAIFLSFRSYSIDDNRDLNISSVRNRLMTFLLSFFYTLFFYLLNCHARKRDDRARRLVTKNLIRDREWSHSAVVAAARRWRRSFFFLRLTEAHKKEVEKLFKLCEESERRASRKICVYICCLSLFSTSVI